MVMDMQIRAMNPIRAALAIAAMAASFMTQLASAIQVDYQEPTLDRWMYPFNATNGERNAASIFGAVGSAGFDDRDAQFILGFDTTGDFAPGQGASNYQINGATLTLTINLDDAFRYDSTYDPYTTYLEGTDPDFVADSDTGRPIELYGVGYRNGFNASTFQETSDFSPPTPGPTERVRNAYALGSDGTGLVDVSNHVTDAFDTTPWALGVTDSVSAGSLVPADTEFTFTLNLANPDVLSYFQDSLDDGMLMLTVSSMHSATLGGSASFPSFYTKDNLLHDPAFGDYLAGQLSLDVHVIPEPTTGVLLLVGASLMFLRRGGKGGVR